MVNPYAILFTITKERKKETMLLQDFQNKFATEIKKGQFTKATWQSIKVVNGIECKKVTHGVVRFVQYGHIQGVVVKGVVNTNEQCLIPNTLYYNNKTNNYLVQLARTETKPTSKYYLNGQEVDKATFETINKPRNYNGAPSVVFRVKLENLLALGN